MYRYHHGGGGGVGDPHGEEHGGQHQPEHQQPRARADGDQGLQRDPLVQVTFLNRDRHYQGSCDNDL